MGDISTVVGGGTPDTRAKDFFGGDVAWLTPADLSGYSEKYISRGARNLSQAGLRNSATRILPRNTVLFTSRAPVGYVAIARNPLCTNQGFKSFVLEKGLSADYVYYYLQYAKPLALRLSSGTTFPELSGKNAAQIPIPVAEATEQARIAETLDELFSDLDAGVAALKRARSRLRRYRESVLKSAVEGTLTADWRMAHPNAESASELLKRILVERRRRWEVNQLCKFAEKRKSPPKKWEARYKEPAGPTADLPPLPEGWCWATVEQCSTLIQYGSSAKSSYNSAGIPVLRMGNITADGRLLLDDLKYLPSDHPELTNLLLECGDLLFNRTNSAELVGKTAAYSGKPSPSSFASYLIRVRLLEGVLPEILALAINGGFGKAWIKRVVNQTVGQANVNASKLAAFTFPLSPIAEQNDIVKAVEEKLSIIDHLEADLYANLNAAQGLRQAILRQAFSGKLLPQNPSDEPASHLLKRIAQEREARAREAAVATRKARITHSRKTSRLRGTAVEVTR